ncbi:MAG TPA: endo-1,4-beta-xylanase [Opitutaceae bacterium]|jgi:GH35 family endo-1,4-beta-xylanase|nr:endo-1,4-beta-xylanase [Opitutaceae bacterium]
MRNLLRILGLAALGLPAFAWGQAVQPTGGDFTYAGREDGAAWRKEALARIELIRKGDFGIRVVDASGAPVPGASVRIEEVKSAFQWGSALQFERLVRDTPDNLRYRQKVIELFNEASPENDLKWPNWEGDHGPGFGHDQAIVALHWLKAHGFYVRGHNLIWPGKGEAWEDLPLSIRALKDTSRQGEIPGLILRHIRGITAATRGLIDEWDVINEPWDHHAMMDLFGPKIMVDWFKAAQEGLPGGLLYLNDWGNQGLLEENPSHWRNTFETAAYLRSLGAPLTALGLQCHINRNPTAPEDFLAALDLYAALRIPIRITEFDVNTGDEALQADYTRDFFIAAFSHPAVIGVQVWGFWEKAHWRPKAAMYRNDWSEKPNGQAYRSLVLGRWRTRLEGKAGADGRYAARGFYGSYRVMVQAGGRQSDRTFSLVAGAPTPDIEVRLP